MQVHNYSVKYTKPHLLEQMNSKNNILSYSLVSTKPTDHYQWIYISFLLFRSICYFWHKGQLARNITNYFPI